MAARLDHTVANRLQLRQDLLPLQNVDPKGSLQPDPRLRCNLRLRCVAAAGAVRRLGNAGCSDNFGTPLYVIVSGRATPVQISIGGGMWKKRHAWQRTLTRLYFSKRHI